MEIKHRIVQFSGNRKFNLLKKKLDKLGLPYNIELLGLDRGEKRYSLECHISENNTHFPEVAKLIKKHSLYSHAGIYYSQQEIDAAEWVIGTVGEFQYPQPEGSYKQTTYDLSNYCERCGMGAIQSLPFKLKRDFKQKNSQFLGLHWVFDEIFVRKETKSLFQKEKITGINFSEALHYKTGIVINNLYQIRIESVTSPGLNTDNLFAVTCKDNNEESYVKGVGRVKNHLGKYPYCGRVKYQYPQGKPYIIKRKSLANSPDIVKSFEYLGSGYGANKLILMNRRVVNLVHKFNIRGLKFRPIELV